MLVHYCRKQGCSIEVRQFGTFCASFFIFNFQGPLAFFQLDSAQNTLQTCLIIGFLTGSSLSPKAMSGDKLLADWVHKNQEPCVSPSSSAQGAYTLLLQSFASEVLKCSMFSRPLAGHDTMASRIRLQGVKCIASKAKCTSTSPSRPSHQNMLNTVNIQLYFSLRTKHPKRTLPIDIRGHIYINTSTVFYIDFSGPLETPWNPERYPKH